MEVPLLRPAHQFGGISHAHPSTRR
jgi:hypothetical protein